MRDYVNEVVKCKPNMIYVDLPQQTLTKIDYVVKQIIQQKVAEQQHINDSEREYKRFYTGLMGECAIEQAYNCTFVDWSIGDSKQYNVADMNALGINVGIKTADLYHFPIVHKKAYRPEFICIRRTDTTVIICGLATMDVLNTFQDDDLIISPNLKQRGTKTGFYGFDHLIKIKSIQELKEIINEKRY